MKTRRYKFYLIIKVILASAFLLMSIDAYPADHGEDLPHEISENDETHIHSFVESQGHETDNSAHKTLNIQDEAHETGHSDKGQFAGAEHEVSHEASENNKHVHQEQTPLIYLLYWGILILSMLILMIYFVVWYKYGQRKPFKSLAIFLILLLLAAYFLEATPIFSSRFDPYASKFVHDFHEGNDLGALRFFYKFLLGIFLTLFAFLNVDLEKFGIGLKKTPDEDNEDIEKPKADIKRKPRSKADLEGVE